MISRTLIPLLLCLPTALTISTLDPGPVVTQPPWPPITLSPSTIYLASWYHLPNRLTASGLPYGDNRVAARHLPFGTSVILCREDHPTICASVIVADRFGNAPADRDYDLPKAVAARLYMLRQGLCRIFEQKVVL